MIFAYRLFLALGAVAFFLVATFGLPARISIALPVFLVPSLGLTFLVLAIGDRPASDAVTVVPKAATPNSPALEEPSAAKRWC